MPSIETTTGANVGPAQNNITSLVCPDSEKAWHNPRLDRIKVVHKAGSLASFSVVVSTDPACADRKKQIASFSAQTPALPVDHDNGGAGYSWDPIKEGATVYVKIVPDAGNDNQFDVRINFGGY